MNEIYRFILPSFIDIPISQKARSPKNKEKLMKGKSHNRYWLTMNNYRNWDKFLEHKIKEAFWPKLGYPVFKADKILISYMIERKSSQIFDTGNVKSIVDKYFCDWLVMEGYVKDDNCDIVFLGPAAGYRGCVENKITAIVKVIKDETQEPEQKNLFCK